MNEIINSDELPAPKGFSHAVKAGDTVYLAGQIGTGTTLAEQFDDAAKNLITALSAAGGTPEDLVSLQIFVTNVADYRRLPDENSARPGASTSAAAIRRWACSV